MIGKGIWSNSFSQTWLTVSQNTGRSQTEPMKNSFTACPAEQCLPVLVLFVLPILTNSPAHYLNTLVSVIFHYSIPFQKVCIAAMVSYFLLLNKDLLLLMLVIFMK